ncbi:intein/RHS repeat-associated protein [Streptomyces sp. 3211.6]|uniref:ricin-type beta-trefoil lectin domain protein n=1 Tax=Streptomyces sp. 3211.6 TaxID=1938845 RepID=UPI000F1D4A7C|nr:ricin-type beta-trefoil lectin domain protein [Streptomyces sp. 3211.6]RKT02186.1 intein/RHS repeat-associated protein [Streptomyces sp. 3211.6]
MSPFSAHNFRLPGNRRARAKRARLAGRTGITVSVALVISLLPIQAWAAPPGDRSGVQLPGLQQDMKAKLDKVEAAKLEGWAGAPVQSPPEYEPSKVTPPTGGTATVALSGDQLVQAGSLPVSIGKASPTAENPTPPAPSGTWSVAVETRAATEAANVDGALIKVTPPAEGSTPVDVQLDYKKFKDLYGTEWATRLELKQLPECFLTTPDLPECTVAQDVPSTNDPATGTVRATIDPATAPSQGLRTMAGGSGGPTVLAASDGASGAGGTYKATSLSPSGSWTAGGSGGGFSWSYPLTVPAPPAGPTPKIGFSYSSQAVDGKTSVANGQASWVGDGWDYEPGYIERRYRTCADDLKANPSKPNNDNATDKKKGDLCWAGDNVVMSLGGSTTELVHDAATGNWIPASDDGSRVEHKTDTTVPNGAKDGEYWIVTTGDGTRYFFGRHDVDGAGSRPVTNSVLTVPVFGNHPGEPCYQSTFAASSCDQGWRWNLDYVEDVHGNAMIIDWAKETNRYAKNSKFKEAVTYARAGYPTQITYGLRNDNLSGPPAGKVEFTVAERCIKEGTTQCSDAEFEGNNYGDKQPWWDTPSTLYCKPTAKDCYVGSPTFWTRKRLTAVTTSAQRTEGSTALSLVDRWTLAQSFPRQRTDTHPPLWLESITRTGYGTTKDSAGNQQSTSLPPISFLANVKDMPNRVATGPTDATPDFDRLRVETIRTEIGGEIVVGYSAPCPVGGTHPKPEENTTRCYPVYWSPDGDLEKPPLEWFNKYVVDTVTEKDRVARQPDFTTSYTYEGDAAWAKNTDEFSKPELRTYSQWRGYASVVTSSGVTANAGKPDATEQSQTRTRYFRGMSGDAGRPKITVKDSTNTEDLGEDLPQYQGQAAESIAYTKAGGSVESRTLNWPWSQKTATRPRDGTTPLDAYRVGAARTDSIQTISGGSTRTNRTRVSHEPVYGLVQTVQKEAVTPNGSGGWQTTDQTCATTTYVHNTDKNLIGLPQRQRTTAGDCAQSGTAALLSDTRTSYDALNAFGVAPVKGLVYQADTNDAAGTGWITSARSEYDALGRATKVYDAAGNAATTTFSPATGTPFSVTTTNALGHTATTKTDPGRGLPVESADVNGRKVTTTYDNLGRTSAVWSPSQNPAKDKASRTFSYQIAEHEPPVVTSNSLNDDGSYLQSIAIYDGFLRPRQTQGEAVGGGRIVTDTLYGPNGTVRHTNNGYYAEGAPEKKIFVPESVFQVPNSTETAYDGLGRAVRTTTLYADVPQFSATAEYGGDYTLMRSAMSVDGTTPLKGSTASKTWTDVLGRTTAVERATSTDLTTWNRTTYTYDVRNKLKSVTDAAGNKWAYEYDGRGRQTASEDPDSGRSEFGFNNLDQLTWGKDSSGRTQYTVYDALGRATELHDDAVNGPLVASWAFDTLPGAKGLPVSSTRYDGTTAYKSEVTGYDAEYRPTGSKITIPDVPGTRGLAGTYASNITYTPTGKVQSTTSPATPGGLAAEKLVTRYNADGLPQSMSGLAWYTADVKYSPFGEVLRTASGNAPNRVWTTTQYNPNNGQVTHQITDRETGPNRISDVSYDYDPAGNITSITDTQPGGREDRQCFAYNPMGQLTKAWTGKTASCTGPSLADVTPGPDGDGFWQEYQFDAIGNRTKLINRDLTDPALDDETTYTYGVTIAGNGTQPPVKTQPHALAKAEKTTRTPGRTVTSLTDYTYDASGNTKTRRIDGDTQTLNWDRRGKITSASSPGIGAASVIGASGKCIDVENAGTADGTPVQIWPCNDTKAQQWRLTGNTVRALDKCLTASGTKLVLATCDGSDKQKFVYRAGDKSLNNPATNQCVDVPNYANDGSDLQLWSCNTTGPQQFTFDTTTTYIYDASGNRLIEETGSSRTLYLGDTEVTVNKAGQPLDAVRYYAGPGATTIRQTGGKPDNHKLSVQLADHHGTATTTIDQSTGQTITRRKSDPYGNPRGAQPGSWPGSRGFLGTGIDDTNTSLTHIGAREYESTTGRFISVDPVIDITDPLQMNGYTYANANPIGNADPSGLKYYEGMNDGGFQAAPDKASEKAGEYSSHSGSYNANTGKYCYFCYNSSSGSSGSGTSGGNSGEGKKSSGGAKGKSPDCSWFSKCGLSKAVDATKKFIHENKVVIAQVTAEVVVGGACVGTAIVAGVATGGAGAAIGLGCAGLAASAGAAAGNFFDDNADHSTTGILKVEGEAFVWGAAGEAAGAAVGVGAAAVVAGIAGRAAGKAFASTVVKTVEKIAAILGSGCSKPGNSFATGTLVVMADGSRRAIEELQPGDQVLASDPETGLTYAEEVTATILGEGSKNLVEITVDSTDNAESPSITATDHHPFWVPDLSEWVDATDLQSGEWLQTSTGTRVQISAVKRWTTSATVRNLTVADFHTYYVVAGSTPVLVHNCNGATLELKYKKGWSADQIAAADRKVAALNASGNLIVTKPQRSGSAADMWRRAGNDTVSGSDIDHIVELQLGGADDVSNMTPLDSSVNRSIGSQISRQLKKQGLNPGDRVCKINITKRC